ncbi:thioredoxin family protein [Bacillus sp. B1-b2]|uniref:thioredoxin family protein n=1 Tax=Bacillus sp. B1-b2 TaxID=2653201 RepID=UPI0012628058|nr:thioredoxin family protein [Bacillus sp. B1-b2]KAB7666888.1 thioredoxin family protein [Bacillus sp. B1-b2]
MKKVLFFTIFTVILFVGIFLLSNYQKDKALEGSLYDKTDLNAATIDQLEDPNYQNIIVPDDLDTKLADDGTATVYFFSSTCIYCKQTTPELMPLADELDVHIDQYNLLEYQDGWTKYNIESTPTLVQFKDGKEVGRIVGYNEPDVFKQWLEEYSVTE